MRLAFLIPPMMLLAACGSEEKKAGEGTEVSINAEGDGGGIKIQTGKDGGKIRIGGDGAAINIDVPDFVDLDVARSADRRVGTECVSPCRHRWLPYHS